MGRRGHFSLALVALFLLPLAAGHAIAPPPVWVDEGAGPYVMTSRVAACPQEGAATFRYVANEIDARYSFRIDRAGRYTGGDCGGAAFSAWEAEFDHDVSTTGAVLDFRSASCDGFVITLEPFAAQPVFEVRMRYTPNCDTDGLHWVHTLAHVPTDA